MTKIIRNAFFCLLLINLVSCSFFKRRGGTPNSKSNQDSQYVTRKQYDILLKKYQSLVKENTALKNDQGGTLSSDTVDLFDEPIEKANQKFGKKKSMSGGQNINISEANIDRDLGLLQNAINYYQAKDFSKALKIFDQLGKSGVDQVRVRSRFYTALILYDKDQLDLALQVFEEVIQHHSFSYLVLDSLKYASDCADRLKLKDKVSKYQSMLNDIFTYI
jgi:tetratricopeptide (TPR) repeat protein